MKEIYDPPLGLYLKGCELSKHRKVAIIGTRRAIMYGLKIAQQFASVLAQRVFCIVSGTARGIDSAAHKGALDANGETYAVLGCGLNIVYPPENIELYKHISNQGCLVSELPLGTPPTRCSPRARSRST